MLEMDGEGVATVRSISGTGKLNADGVELGEVRYRIQLAPSGNLHQGVFQDGRTEIEGKAFAALRVSLVLRDGRDIRIVVDHFQPSSHATFRINADLP